MAKTDIGFGDFPMPFDVSKSSAYTKVFVNPIHLDLVTVTMVDLGANTKQASILCNVK